MNSYLPSSSIIWQFIFVSTSIVLFMRLLLYSKINLRISLFSSCISLANSAQDVYLLSIVIIDILLYILPLIWLTIDHLFLNFIQLFPLLNPLTQFHCQFFHLINLIIWQLSYGIHQTVFRLKWGVKIRLVSFKVPLHQSWHCLEIWLYSWNAIIGISH